MATIEEALVTRVEAVVSAPIFPLQADEDQALPFIVYRRVSGTRLAAMKTDVDDASARFQFDTYAETHAEAESIAASINGALSRYSGEVANITITSITRIDHRDLSAGAEYARRVMQDFTVKWEEGDEYSIAFSSDPHAQSSLGVANFQTCLSWLNSQAQTKRIPALIITGDLVDSPTFEVPFLTWLRSADDGNLRSDIQFLPVIGNHDAEAGISSTVAPDPPHSTIVGRYPDLFAGEEWYSWTYSDQFKFMALNDITDEHAGGINRYSNCNPPGDTPGPPANPDHGGMSVAGSEQRVWFEAQCDGSYPWQFSGMHRPPYCPYDSDGRPQNEEVRPAFVTPIDNGLDAILAGDIHLGSLSGPWRSNSLAAAGEGAWAMTAAGGYVIRRIDDDVLPDQATTLHWYGDRDTGTHISHMMLFSFKPGRDYAELRIFECTDENPTGYMVDFGEDGSDDDSTVFILARNTNG